MTERSQFGRCRSCFGTILWALNENGKPVPFDVAENGDHMLVVDHGHLRAHRACPKCPHANDDHERGACVVTLNNSKACGCTAQRAVSHFATCPDAHHWRAGEKRRTP